jgi:hypothetical protein
MHARKRSRALSTVSRLSGPVPQKCSKGRRILCVHLCGNNCGHMELKVLESVSFFSRGQKVLKFSALFCQLSLNMLGRQQRLICLLRKISRYYKWVKQSKITKRNICIHMHWEVALDLSELFRWTIFELCCSVLSHYYNVYYFLTLFAT